MIKVAQQPAQQRAVGGEHYADVDNNNVLAIDNMEKIVQQVPDLRGWTIRCTHGLVTFLQRGVTSSTPHNVIAVLWSGQAYTHHSAMHWVETTSTLLGFVLTMCLIRSEPSNHGRKEVLRSLLANVVLGVLSPTCK